MPQLYKVESAFPALVLADERLWFAQRVGYIGLPQTGVFAVLPEQGDEPPMRD